MNNTQVELLKIALQIAQQEKNSIALATRLGLPVGADLLTVVLAIAQDLRKALAMAEIPA